MKINNNSNSDWLTTLYGGQRLLTQSDTGMPEQVDLKLLRLHSGKSTSHHFHLHRKSWFYVLSGQVQATSRFNHWQQQLTPGDLLTLDAGEDHFFTNIGATEAQILEIGSPGHMSRDKIPFSAPGRQCPVPPGRFWRHDQPCKSLIAEVLSRETASHCHVSGVDA
ncbi:MAG: cupin domain-containing protein, partial [Magnetococcales bacterium]|nr:cupin domain-containing protein [Magnetococcales bacterium]